MRERKDRSRKSLSAEEIVKSRTRAQVRGLVAYSVPHIDCPVKLDGNESPFAPPPELSENILEELRKIPVNRYPDPEATALRANIAQMSKFPPGGILLGNGSDELIEMLMRAFSGRTRRVLYPAPTFSMYRITAATLGLDTVPVELDEKFDIEIEATLRAIREKNPDLIFLASPNNPTGNRFSGDRIIEILERARGVVVVDEAYSDFAVAAHLPLIEKYPNLIVLRTLSKIGFAGLRLGILFAHEALAREVNKVRMPYNVNSLTQRAAEVVLANFEFVGENIQLIIRERDRVSEALRQMRGAEVFPTDANFVLMRVGDADDVFERLAHRGILVRNFHSAGGRLANCLRVTIGAPHENDALLAAIGDILG
ncbi:MAG: histidinol-phosphate transaminase [Deltaproteobacteria bacterium]